MKNIFKSLMIVVLFVGLGSSAFAQTSATISSSAVVQTALTISTTDDDAANLVFGTVAQDVTASISAQNGTTVNCGVGAHLGKFTVAAQAGSSVHVSFNSTNLIHESEELAYTPSVYRTHLTEATFGSELVNFTGDDYYVNEVATAAESGVDHFFVGGSIVIGAEATVGSYTGTITMTVAYN